MKAPLLLAIYDLSEDRERNAVSRVLEGHGFRVQYSAFECRLSKGMLSRVRERLAKLGLQSGFVRLYRVDARAQPLDSGTPSEGARLARAICYIA